ncbi:MAG: rhodanese-like domain-containing protein [Gammaproteobacteria bacterium]|nr:rhodanese-like domain-containing protein [Gammaproteobacteria bacterium]
MQQLIEFASNNILLVSVLVVILLLLASTWILPRNAKPLSPMDAVRTASHEDALVLDLRSENEYQDGHILNSVNIPLGFLESRVSEIQEYKSSPVILVCRSGNRSLQAANMLKKQAFENLYNMTGGILAWKNANLPLESSS